MITRRSLFANLGMTLLGATALSACTTTRVGTVTTVVISTDKIRNYVDAGFNAARTVNSVLMSIPGGTVYAVPINTAVTALTNALETFNAIVGDKVTVTYDNQNVKTIVDSILNIISQILNVISDVLVDAVKSYLPLSSDTVSKVTITRDALATIVSVFKALIGTSFASNGMMQGVPMTEEKKALQVLASVSKDTPVRVVSSSTGVDIIGDLRINGEATIRSSTFGTEVSRVDQLLANYTKI